VGVDPVFGSDPDIYRVIRCPGQLYLDAFRVRGFLNVSIRRIHQISLLSRAGLVLLGLVLACVAGEALVRVATATQQNYLIEMWRYATLLKRHSADPVIGHEHIPNASASLQGVEVSINSLGMRGPEPNLTAPGKRKIVIIGDSTAMGWGVVEENTLRGQLATELGPTAEVMTTGIGNMNMTQIVAHWLRYSERIRPDTVILLATARAPDLQAGEDSGWLVRHSQLYALGVSFVHIAIKNTSGKEGLVDHYREIWASGPGREAMDAALDRLNTDREKYGYRVIVMLVPEPHSYHPYLFDFTTVVMRGETESRNWTFIDPLPELQQQQAETYWISKSDVHPNAKALNVMTNLLKPYLESPHG
jgi:hypothetical protein